MVLLCQEVHRGTGGYEERVVRKSMAFETSLQQQGIRERLGGGLCVC